MRPFEDAYTKSLNQCRLENGEAGSDNTETGLEAAPDIGADHAVRDVGKVKACGSVNTKC
jgi:hypothetical protein